MSTYIKMRALAVRGGTERPATNAEAATLPLLRFNSSAFAML